MIKISSVDIVDFVNEINTKDQLRRKYGDVWIDFYLMLELFQNFKGTKHISKMSFLRKLNIVSSSNTYNLHHKREWNNDYKVSNNTISIKVYNLSLILNLLLFVCREMKIFI